MIVGNHLRALAGLSILLLLCPQAELLARTKKGEKYLKLARAAEARKDFEQALDLYNQALSEDPVDPSYILGMRRARFQAGEAHVQAGQKLRDSGQVEPSLVEFQKAFAVDPSSAVALQELRRTTEMIERNRKGNTPPGEVSLTPIETERKAAQDRISSLQNVPQLKPITNQISALKMNNQPPKVLYETVGKLAGINVVFDPQYQSAGKNVNLDLTNTTLEEALDYIAMQTKTFWKPISANTIFIAEDNVTKRRDYEDQVVKVFYLKNVTSVQEFQEIVTAVRSVTDIRRMFTYGAQNAVMCRGTVDQIALAEKLFHDLDKPKSEVVVDVLVMEVNRDRTRNLAAALQSGGTTGLVLPIGFNVGGTTTSTGTTTGTTSGTTTGTTTGTTSSTTSTTSNGTLAIGGIGKIGNFSLSLPSALLQAVATDNSTKVMQSPQVRASDGQKVSLRIGDKVPFATGSFQPGVGTVGVSPLVSTQFNFAEVGVNVDMTPHVHGTDELTLHVLIEVSQVSSYVTIGGVSQPVISQRKNEAEVRLRDGEVTLLGGLMQTQDTNSISGLPGIVNIPVLGGLLFGSHNKDVNRQELMIALIPHIVRSPSVTPVDMRGVYAGTDQTVKMMYAPNSPAAPTQPIALPQGAPVTPPVLPPPAPVSGGSGLIFVPPSIQVPLSAPAIVTLQVQNASDLMAAPFKLKWDPKLLRLNQVTPGTLIGDSSPQVSPPTIDIRNDSGEASITLSRVDGAPGVNGSGPLVGLSFTAVGKGTGLITVTEIGLKNSKQQTITVVPPSLSVTVQ
jgi:general secretion pathway protein D